MASSVFLTSSGFWSVPILWRDHITHLESLHSKRTLDEFWTPLLFPLASFPSTENTYSPYSQQILGGMKTNTDVGSTFSAIRDTRQASTFSGVRISQTIDPAVHHPRRMLFLWLFSKIHEHQSLFVLKIVYEPKVLTHFRSNPLKSLKYVSNIFK